MNPLEARVLAAAGIHSNIKDVKFCYEQGLAKNNTLTGRVTIKFMISGTGQVMMAAVANSTLNNAEVESCMIRKLKTWHFPQPDGGGVVIVTYPFQLIAPEYPRPSLNSAVQSTGSYSLRAGKEGVDGALIFYLVILSVQGAAGIPIQ